MKLFILLVFSSLTLIAHTTYSCNTEYVTENNKKYLPPNSLKFFKNFNS